MTTDRSHPLTLLQVAAVLALGAGLTLVRAQEPEPAARALPELAVESLGEPIRTMRRAGDFLIPKPAARGWYFLTSYHPISRNPLPLQYALVDLDTGTAVIRTTEPSGAFVGGWHNNGILGADGHFYLGHYAKAGIWDFDRATAELTWLEPAILSIPPMSAASA